MQQKLFFLRTQLLTKSFESFLKFFLCLFYFFFMWDHFDICQGAYVHLGISLGALGPFMPIFVCVCVCVCVGEGGGRGGGLIPTLHFKWNVGFNFPKPILVLK